MTTTTTAAPLTGERLFDLWVRHNLCHDREYMWQQLTPVRQHNWNRLAETLNEHRTEDARAT